ncbi:uncharacterized protein LOC109503777 isoform X2 [Harpegnathos saltator]|uniref:uncharacterized protein LOC109503777 isoform X2 n=1 Tax=Harpegnathos saltator TaxID=610380 RepID=UPI000DBEDEE9|nr:uncharacterized protein LOC109503777 isoform X2 [Harpegnathos saltator]
MYLQVEEHYYTINKAFLKALGIWPVDKSYLNLLQQVLIFILTITYIGMQVAAFITTKIDINLFVKIMSTTLPYVIVEVIYCSFIFKSETLMQMHRRIQEDWEILHSKAENEIMLKHIQKSLTYDIILFLLSGFIIFIGIVIQFYPIILDVISPLDKPRIHKLIISAEYFTSENKYFYTKVLHEFVIIVTFVSILLSTGTQLLTFTHHCLGLFKIASYRLHHSIEDSMLRMSNLEWEHAFCKKITHAVIAHRKAMEFADFMVASFNISYCILTIIAVISLSFNIYQFIDAIKVSNNIADILLSFFISLFHLIYMLMANYLGEMISDYHREIFTSSYDISWYVIPISSRKLLLFLMQKASKDFHFMIGYIFVAKIQNFVTLANTALSYVTVMYSVQR